MKKIFLILAFVVSAVFTASADDFQFLTVQQSDGVEQSFTAAGLTITFSQGNMVLNENGTTTTISLADLSKMFFTNEATGIKNLPNESEESLAVYDLSGRKVMDVANSQLRNLSTSQLRNLSTSQLPKGVYIVNGKKIVVK